MTEHSASEPGTALDRFFAALRGIGIRRRTDDKWIAGVCSGLADRLGVDPVIVRVALVVLSAFWGFGITVYLVAWSLLPNDRDEIAAQRAVRDGDGGSVFLLVITTFALFGGPVFGRDADWAVILLLLLGIPLGLFAWWLSHPWARGKGGAWRAPDRPDAGQRVGAQQPATPYSAGSSPTTFGASPPTLGPSPAGPASGATLPTSPLPARTDYSPPVPRKPRRRSGGPLMVMVAIGLALVTYGSLIWLGTEYAWPGNQAAVALAGSLAAIGLLLVAIGSVGWRAGFLSFLTVVLAIAAWSSTLLPAGIQFDASAGDETWAPTSVTTDGSYRLGAGEGVLDLSGLPTEGLSEARLPAYVGLGELTVVVPEGLTVKVMGHVGLGEILLPADAGSGGQGGTDVSRSVVIGDGPTEVVVDAGVGMGQLIVVKE